MLNASLRVHDSNMEPRILNPPRCQFPQLAIKSTNDGKLTNPLVASFRGFKVIASRFPAVVENLQVIRTLTEATKVCP